MSTWREGGDGERRDRGEEEKSGGAKRRAQSKRVRRGQAAPYIVSGTAGCCQVAV